MSTITRRSFVSAAATGAALSAAAVAPAVALADEAAAPVEGALHTWEVAPSPITELIASR